MNMTFILVEPSVPENIGAAVRALNTMGFSKLSIVNPKCDHLADKAFMLAHASYDILRSARIFDTLKEALVGHDLIVGTTSKHRSAKHDYYPVDELLPFLENKEEIVESCALVFGRENSGLFDTEMSQCHIASSIPLIKPYPSINLAQAVMIYTYSLSRLSLQKNIARPNNVDVKQFDYLKKRVAYLMNRIGMKEEYSVHKRICERVFAVGQKDVHLLHSICEAVEKVIDHNN